MSQNFARHSLDVLNELALRTCNWSNNCPLRKKSKLRAAKKQTPNQYSICVYLYIYIHMMYMYPSSWSLCHIQHLQTTNSTKKPSIVFEFHHNLLAPHLSPPHQDFPTYERACFCKADSGLFNRCGKEPLQVVEFCDTNLRDQPKNLVGWLDFSKWRIPVEFVLLHNTWWFQISEKTPWHLGKGCFEQQKLTLWGLLTNHVISCFKLCPCHASAKKGFAIQRGSDGDPRGKVVFTRKKQSNLGLKNAQVANMNYMGVSKNRGTPKWMVYNGKPY